MSVFSKVNQYRAVNTQGGVMDADPHRLIQMLFTGAVDHMASAKGYIERNDYEQRNRHLSKAIQIIGGLREALNTERGGELAKNLEALYDYIERRLFEANVQNNSAIVDECLGLLHDVKSAWDEIRPQVINGSPTAGGSV